MASALDVKDQLAELERWARFGKAVYAAALGNGIVPKRVPVKTRVVQKTKVVYRSPRRTKAEMAAARAVAAPAPTAPSVESMLS